VLVTVSDKKLAVSANGTTIDYYNADVVTANDYYPFGSQMPGRKYSQPNSSYRYGFNGKELDKDMDGNCYDYGFRIYNPSLGRFLSVDPLTANYPWYTPYQFAGNNPIKFIDLDGLEEVDPEFVEVIDGNTILTTEVWRDLSPSEWKSSDRQNASNTFASAAAYNTKNLNSSVYKPVDQIHKYYVWTAREIDKTKASIKFFHAARDVTSIFGVGGAFISPGWLTGLSDAGRKSLADVNSHLLNLNMPVINDILNNGGSNAVNGKGIIWDFNYVAREQGSEGLQGVLDSNPLSESDATAINDNFKTFEAIHPEYKLAKALTGVTNINYKDQKQRMAIGRSLVFLEHMFDQGFSGSQDFYNAVEFLNKEYGSKNVDKFFEVLDATKTITNIGKKINDE
jgi:RHS repeat-associated protein